MEMYLALAAAAGGPILELACGSGRVCVSLAAAGHRVTGVDHDAAMLERAREAWRSRGAARATRATGPRPAGATRSRPAGGHLRLVEGDATEVRLGSRFALVLLALNSLLLFDGREAQRRVLEVIARHLADDGRAVIDVWLPSPDDLALYDGRSTLEWVRHDETNDEWVAKTTSARYAPASSVAIVDTFFDAWRQTEPARRTHRRDRVTFIGVAELLALVRSTGLDPEIVAGDHDMSVLEDDSERVVLVCRPRRPGLL